jgi:hypothetical protein
MYYGFIIETKVREDDVIVVATNAIDGSRIEHIATDEQTADHAVKREIRQTL